MDNDHPGCLTCPFWKAYHERIEGECRRYPPSIPHTESQIRQAEFTIGSEVFDGVFPTTNADDWCGEHPSLIAWVRHKEVVKQFTKDT